MAARGIPGGPEERFPTSDIFPNYYFPTTNSERSPVKDRIPMQAMVLFVITYVTPFAASSYVEAVIRVVAGAKG